MVIALVVGLKDIDLLGMVFARIDKLTRGVIPAKAGIYMLTPVMDSRLRGNDILFVPPIRLKWLERLLQFIYSKLQKLGYHGSCHPEP